jgi:hypothetical protein
VNFRSYADSGLWFVFGSSLLDPSLEQIDRVLSWCGSQDVDQSGVLSLQEAADWEDMLCVRGKGLYVNCLYVAALRRAAVVAAEAGDRRRAEQWRLQADAVAEKVNALFWYSGDGQVVRHMAHSFTTPDPEKDSLGRPRRLPEKRALVEEHYYLPYLGFRSIGEWFDSFGNLLAILSGVANAGRADAILDLMRRYGLEAAPVRAIHPPILPGDPDWRDYYAGLNEPDCYHNGGVWPFLGGFYVAALVKRGQGQASEAALERLAELNVRGGFNEWHHGRTLEPSGAAGQAWSAGMFLYAVECVRAGRALYFEGG